MYNFNCKICKSAHPVYTLIEMPQPTIISDITSGQLDLPMNIISKDIFVINHEYFYFESELSIPIKDYEDSLDFLVWVKVWENELMSKKEALLADRFITVKGSLDAYLPFYPESFEQSVSITIDNQQEKKSFISHIEPLNELSVDFEKGITWQRLIDLLEKYYHHN